MKNFKNISAIIIDVIRGRASIMRNISYITILQIFIVIAPLITYPYLTKVLGMELYGLIISAQVLVSYASLIINFGSDKVCAKHVAIHIDNKEKQSEVLCSVLFVRFFMWVVCFIFYVIVVWVISTYRNAWLLFILSYGMTFNDLLFPQFFFQGIEKMKHSVIISIITRLLFIIPVFFVVTKPADYCLVPLLYTIGSLLSGAFSFVIIFGKMKYKFYFPGIKTCLWYVKDSSPLFAVDLIMTIKDKFNVLLLGLYSGMANVVVYDLGTKINSFLNKPNEIISTVMLPRFSRSRDLHNFKLLLGIVTLIVSLGILLVNIFLPSIVNLFIHQQIDLIPLRVFSIAPLFISISSCIATNLLVAFGYNKYMLNSILVTTGAYIVSLVILYFSRGLNSVFGFIILALISYFVELIYRVYLTKKVIQKESHK